MFGNISNVGAEEKSYRRGSIRINAKMKLLQKLGKIDSDSDKSSDASSETSNSSSSSSDSSNSKSNGSVSSSDDSVKKLKRQIKKRKANAAHRKNMRMEREEKLREREAELDALESNARMHQYGGTSTGESASLGGLGANSDPHAINHVAEILRALKGKGSLSALPSPVASPGSIVGKSPDQEKRSASPPVIEKKGNEQDEMQKSGGMDREEALDKFKSAVKRTKSITAFNKVGDEASIRSGTSMKAARRANIDFSDDGLGHLTEVGKLVNSMNTKLKRAEDRKNMSGLAKFLSSDVSKVHHDDFDSGVNAMALLCALVLSVPYQVAGTLGSDNLDWMKGQIDECTDEWNYAFVYTGYRASFIMTVYFSISGMILATFYFLFKRNNDFDFRIWRSKARYLVVLLFFCTAFSIIGLILLTNLYFDYYMLSSTENICSNNTLPYVAAGCGVSFFAFVGAFYLIL